MADIQEINDSNFKDNVIDSENVTVVDFFAPWCGPCRKMADVIAQLADEYQGKISVYKLNTDDNIKTAKEYSISSLPSILIFKNGEAKERLVGLMPKSSLINNIEKYL
ncbi:MAG: thioredoxin [Candidatus Gastranaerophilaceae bacterium]